MIRRLERAGLTQDAAIEWPGRGDSARLYGDFQLRIRYRRPWSEAFAFAALL
jgi:hypothetical protein